MARPSPAGAPYFLFVNYLDAHAPWALRPGPRWARLRPGWPANDVPALARAELAAGMRSATPEEAAHLTDLYDDAIAFLDQHVGILIEALQREPDYQRTLIVVTSDHGEALGEHSSLGHGPTLYGEVLDVPLIVRRPGAKAGRVDDTPVQTMDLFPTLLQSSTTSLRYDLSMLPASERWSPASICDPPHRPGRQ